jgi:hypothetical protein
MTSSPCTLGRLAKARPMRTGRVWRCSSPRARRRTRLTRGISQTLFQGTTLRGLLLEAYAFGTFGQIALVAAIASFILAGIMLVLTLFGLLHFRRVPEDAEFPAVRATGRVPVPA